MAQTVADARPVLAAIGTQTGTALRAAFDDPVRWAEQGRMDQPNGGGSARRGPHG